MTSKAALQHKRRQDAINEASAVERHALNRAIEDGARIVLDTAVGEYVVTYVDADWWYHAYRQGGPPAPPYSLASRPFAGCNDGTWAALLQQGGVRRHPLFAAYA